MKLGYPCRNLSLETKSSNTFQLKRYSETKIEETIAANLHGLQDMLAFNVEHGLLFARITSDLIPFASHPVCEFDWRARFANEFAEIGRFIRSNGLRVSVHPGQYVLLNSPRPEVAAAALEDLRYHADFLDLMDVDTSAKIQIHVGGVYGDKPASMARFCRTYHTLPTSIKRRLAIENDERHYSLADCKQISDATGVPIIFDVFHHSLLNAGETLAEAFSIFEPTWGEWDGPPIVDYSSQAEAKRIGAHTMSIDLDDFRDFLSATTQFDFDIMLEIKDKETSALAALPILRQVRNPA